MAPIALPAEFGYVGLVVAATFFMNFWHMMRIGSLRKKYGIKYPAMTSDKHEDFMYAQRVHQNNLEQLPFFYANLVSRISISRTMSFADSTFYNFVIFLAPRRRLQPHCRRHHGRRVGGGSDRLLSGLLLCPGKEGPRRRRCNPHSCRHGRLQLVLIPQVA